MKIAMIEEDLSIRSGSRRFICEATRRLEAQGHRVRIFASRMNEKTCFEDFLSLPVEVTPIKRPYLSHLLKQTIGRTMDYYWAYWQMTMEISKRVADWRPDFVIFHYTGEIWLPPYFFYLEKPVGAVCLHTIPRGVPPFHSSTLREKIDQSVLSLPPLGNWTAHGLEKLSMIISHSRFVHEQALRIESKTRPLTAIVPLGVDHSEFSPTGEEEPYALCIARIDPKKRLELALHAMKNASSKYSLIIAGDVEDRFIWYKNKLLDLAKKVGISQRFEIVQAPTHPQIVRLMQKSAVFLFPSTNDTFGLVVLEAMACGKPIVASRAGGVPELLNNCGLLLDPKVNQWQETLGQLLANRNLREMIGQKAFERSKMYSWDHTTSSLLRAIENFMASEKTLN